jgi:uncharacterized protein YkwD
MRHAVNAALILLVCQSGVVAAQPSGTRMPDLERTAAEVVERTNRFRQAQGLGPVDPDPALKRTAVDFAQYLARTDRFGHEADGSTPGQRAEAQGYEICLISENLAYQFDSRGFSAEGLAEKTVTGWIESPGHRENMVDPDVTETGVGVARSQRSNQYYLVQLFGRPRSESIGFRIANDSGTAVSYRLGDQRFELPPRYRRTHTQCRPAELTLDWPGQRGSETVQPADGDAFTVVQGQSGELRLRSDD